MWLNKAKVVEPAVCAYQEALINSCPNHVVIDGLFDESKLDEVIQVLHNSTHWQTQKHTYSALYVDNKQWESTRQTERFVKRDVWQRDAVSSKADNSNNKGANIHNWNIADDFLSFLRSDEFMAVLSRIFNVTLTDMHVGDPELNTNYFRLNTTDFVEQHVDDSPGREVCMLLYLNKAWQNNAGGELVFLGDNEQQISIAPLFNRCVLFDPSSHGSEHWVKRLATDDAGVYRYNVTSWYWSE